jgi:uncharacterized protein (TIGR03067 family)
MKAKLVALALIFGAWAVSVSADEQDAKKALAELKGTWQLVNEVDAGTPFPADPKEVFIFNGESLVNKVDTKVTDEFTLKIDPTKTPKEIDLVPQKDPNKGVPAPAIYKVEGNKLTICVNFTPGAKRPSNFESNNTNRNIILTMQKMDAGKSKEK